MRKLYGIEIGENSEVNIEHYFDKDLDLYIFNKEEFINHLEKLQPLKEPVSTYELILLKKPLKRDVFLDYGFISEINNHYLYSDKVAAFTIHTRNSEQKEMFLLQVEEHLIASELNEEMIYFVDENFKALIKKFGLAYDVEVIYCS